MYGQGFFFARPVPADGMDQLLPLHGLGCARGPGARSGCGGPGGMTGATTWVAGRPGHEAERRHTPNELPRSDSRWA